MNQLPMISATNLPTVIKTAKVDGVKVKPSQTSSELIDRVREASASISDIRLFLQVLGKKLLKSDLPTVEYALARAYYREGRSLTVRQVALLGTTSALKTTEKQVRGHMRYLGIAAGDVLSNLDASRVLCRLPEPDTAN